MAFVEFLGSLNWRLIAVIQWVMSGDAVGRNCNPPQWLALALLLGYVSDINNTNN